MFSKHSKPSAKVLLRRTKEKKCVAPVLSCLDAMYSTGSLNLKAIMDSIKDTVHPPKATDKKVPHSQCAALEFVDRCLRSKAVAWNGPANSVAVVEIALLAMGPTYDTKVRAAASDLAALVVARSKSDEAALPIMQSKLNEIEASNKVQYTGYRSLHCHLHFAARYHC